MYDESEEMKKIKLKLSNAEYRITKLEEENAWLKASYLIEKEAEKQGVPSVEAMQDVLDRARRSGTWEIRGGRAVRVKNGSVELFPSSEEVTDKSFLRNIAPEAPHLFGQPSDTSKATGGPNPFIKGPHFNLTRQAEILKADPAKAKKLAAEAGLQLAI
jgi:hypothetical protein